MDNDFKNLYNFYRENALLITKIRQAEEFYRKQFYGTGNILVSEISNDLNRIESFPRYINTESFQNGLINIISSFQSEDYVLCADSLNNFIYGVMLPLQNSVFNDLSEYISELFDPIMQNSDGLFDLEETLCGYTTILYHSDKEIYLCSTDDPMTEGYALAKEAFAPEADAYHIWGMGLGYHVYALFKTTYGSTDIYVYDNDTLLFDLASSGKLGPWQNAFDNPRIHFITDPDVTGFSAALSKKDSKCIIHIPSLHKLSEKDPSDASRKSILKKLQITLNTFEEQKNKIYLNFYKNIKHTDGFAEDLFKEFAGQKVIIVAAGPSLDRNIDVIKKVRDADLPVKVICVGTVLRKLINAGITPDAFFILDANDRVYSQIKELEQLTIPIIINTSAYYAVAQNYHGKKYLACPKDFELSENLGHTLFNTGSSVTTLALDFAIQAKAQVIIMAGCDMAFTGNASHAKDTAEKHSTNNDAVIAVKGYYGDTVNTSIQLSIFREWIERRLRMADTAGIRFINSTEGGAYIEGMEHIPLKEALGE